MFRNLTVTYQQEAEALPQSQTINSAPTNKMTKVATRFEGYSNQRFCQVLCASRLMPNTIRIEKVTHTNMHTNATPKKKTCINM
jgi:hypothetical protein